MRLTLGVVALALLLAGCIDMVQPAGRDSPSGGSQDDAPAMDSGAGAEGNVSEPEPEPETRQVNGRTSVTACVVVTSVPCAANGVGGSNDSFDIDHTEAQCRFRGTLSWKATSPQTEQLELVVRAWRDGEQVNRSILRGPSPIEADFAIAGDLEWSAYVTARQRIDPPGTDIITEVPQDFLLEFALFEGDACSEAPPLPVIEE